jgi:hypothetical protein
MTAKRTLILAGTFSEAAKYARGMGLRHYRYAVNAYSVANFRADDIVQLPGYAKRRDQHAFKSIIRNAAHRGVIVRQDEYIPPPPPPEPEKPFLQTLTKADWLFGSVDEIKLRDLGATDDEVATFVGVAETAKRIDQLNEKTADEILGPPGLTDEQEAELDAIDEPVPAPKRRGRRTNEQKAYDEALADWESNGGTIVAVHEARTALAERHPDDERLKSSPAAAPADVDDLFED